MHRRDYLAATTACLGIGLAGCSNEEPIDDPQSTPADTSTPRDSEDPTPTRPSGEAQIQLGDRKLVRDDSGYSTEVYAEAIVENTGSAPSGQIELTVEWYDADGNYLDDSTGRLYSLGAGEVWIAQISSLVTDSEDIDSMKVSGDFEVAPPVPPKNMEVTESAVEVGEYSAEITGVAENSREDELGYVEAHGKLYDDQGRVIGGGWTNQSDIPPQTNWAFGIRLSGRAEERAGDAADHAVLLDADLF